MIKVFKTTRVICLLLVLAVISTLAGCKKIVPNSQSLSTTSVRTQAESSSTAQADSSSTAQANSSSTAQAESSNTAQANSSSTVQTDNSSAINPNDESLTLPDGKKWNGSDWNGLNITLNYLSFPTVYDDPIMQIIGNHAEILSQETVTLKTGSTTLVLVERTLSAAEEATLGKQMNTYEYWLIQPSRKYIRPVR